MHDVVIIRHGESTWNAEHRWQGWLDAPLTDLGREQARRRAHSLADAGFLPSVVHCSDLGRARRTADILAEVLGAPCRPHPGLRERSAGEWEGHTSDEIDERWPGMRDRLCERGAAIRPHIHVYVDSERAGLDTRLDARSRVDVIAAISGG